MTPRRRGYNNDGAATAGASPRPPPPCVDTASSSAGAVDPSATDSAASTSATSASSSTVSLIQQFESFVASPKPDPIGLPTVSFGHTTFPTCATVLVALCLLSLRHPHPVLKLHPLRLPHHHGPLSPAALVRRRSLPSPNLPRPNAASISRQAQPAAGSYDTTMKRSGSSSNRHCRPGLTTTTAALLLLLRYNEDNHPATYRPKEETTPSVVSSYVHFLSWPPPTIDHGRLVTKRHPAGATTQGARWA
ncbi:hypothetical protein BDZ97DRAFT_1924906 [Flammula alnicola]|nr:hypothetical protein BDZ97DRAFT_1924906 [Flammula alnicola]